MSAEMLVSVIIPTYNRKDLVQRAVSSVLNQTYRNLELLVVDDGSNDGSGEALSYFNSDPRFHYTYQENRGQSAARNRAIASASGDLIAFLDSDNYWAPDKIQRQLAFWSGKTEYDILYSLGFSIDIAGNIVLSGKQISRPSGWILDQLIFSNFITNNTVLVARHCFQKLGSFDESLRIAEDYDLWLRFATRHKFLHHPERVTYYCVEGERLSAHEEQNIEVNFQILSKFFQEHPNQVSSWKQKQAMSNLLTWRIESRWNRGIRPSVQEILRTITCNPFDQRTWRHLAKYVISSCSISE
jgi:glycosyltransferase involved in cell wall biosynthesis